MCSSVVGIIPLVNQPICLHDDRNICDKNRMISSHQKLNQFNLLVLPCLSCCHSVLRSDQNEIKCFIKIHHSTDILKV